MELNINKSREKIDNRLLVIFIISLVAMGASIEGFMSHSVKLNNLVNLILPITYIFFLMCYRVRLANMKNLWIVMFCLSVVQILVVLKWGMNNILIGRYYDVIIAFVFLRALGLRKFFFYFETSVVFLTKISLILWGMVVVMPWLHTFLIPFSFPMGFVTIDFTWGIVGLATSEGLVLRNLGFAWEPGRFSSILVLVFLIHLFRNHFQLFQKNFWTLLLGLLSTQSSTGYFAFTVCIMGFLINTKDAKLSGKFIKSFILIGFVILCLVSPFMLEKLQLISDSNQWINERSVSNMWKNGRSVSFVGYQYVPQRVEGLYLEMLNIIDSPLIGYGDDKNKSFVCSKLFPQIDIVLSNGLLQIIAMLGIPICILLYISLWKSSKLIAELYNVNGKYLFFLLICLINISYNFFVEPFIILITLYSVLRTPQEQNQYAVQLCPSCQS